MALGKDDGLKESHLNNVDAAVVRSFGEEWDKFDHRAITGSEEQSLFESYFTIFPWDKLPRDPIGFDLGCGSGRWAAHVAPRVGKLHCIDPSPQALKVAEQRLKQAGNCELHCASVDAIPLADAAMDFGYSLGVLHHVPDTEAGIRDCAAKLKPGAPFLLYLYYALENRPAWYRALWRISDVARKLVSGAPFWIKAPFCDLVALLVYWPLSRMARLAGKLGLDTRDFPLSSYQDRSFYVLRTDALDRLGTRLEKRFTREQIEAMLRRQGFDAIRFSERMPFWCAVAFKQ